MFEVAGTHFQKGTFELDLEKRPGGLFGWGIRLGAIRGRLVALSLIVLAGFLTFRRQPARWLLTEHSFEPQTAMLVQNLVTWALLGIGAAIYMLIIVRRHETLKLAFDRTKGQFRFVHTPGGRYARAQEGIFPFDALEQIEVFGPEREPATPHGFVDVALKADRVPENYRHFRFRLLTDEQFRFFPANIAKMTGLSPKGDFKDPDDELVDSRPEGR